MTHNLTPTAQHSTSPIALPDNGEDDGIESIETAFQALLDRSALALAAGSGLMRGADEFAVEQGGTSSSFTITVGGIQSLILPNEAGTLYQSFFYVSGSPTITEANIAGGVLANSTRYYVYAFNNAGTLAFEIVTDPPRASRVHKTGAGAGPAARRYLGCFPTDSSGNPAALRAVRGRYTFRGYTVGAIATAQNTANTSTWTGDLSLASRIPPHARVVRLRVTAHRASAGVATWTLRASGDTLASVTHTFYASTSGQVDEKRFEIALGSTQAVQVATESNTTIDTIDVDGWDE